MCRCGSNPEIRGPTISTCALLLEGLSAKLRSVRIPRGISARQKISRCDLALDDRNTGVQGITYAHGSGPTANRCGRRRMAGRLPYDFGFSPGHFRLKPSQPVTQDAAAPAPNTPADDTTGTVPPLGGSPKTGLLGGESARYY